MVRLHGFRGTWQYVAREHVRWMLGLIGDRVIASSASRFRELELDHKTLRPFTAPTRSEREALALAAERYGEFLGLETRLLH